MSNVRDFWKSLAWLRQNKEGAIHDLFGFGEIDRTVTQLTSITTGVTLSKNSGTITCVTSPSIAAGAEATFTVTNTIANTTSVIAVSVATQPSDGMLLAFVSAVADGSFNITLTNVSAADTTAGTPVINFVVLGGALSA